MEKDNAARQRMNEDNHINTASETSSDLLDMVRLAADGRLPRGR